MKINITFSKKTDANGCNEVIFLVRRKVKGKVVDLRAKSKCFVEAGMYDPSENKVKKYSAKKICTPQVKYHNEQVDRLAMLVAYLDRCMSEADSCDMHGTWLADLVDRYNFPEKDRLKREQLNNIYTLFELYMKKMQYKESYYKGNMVMARCLARYEHFKRLTSKGGYAINIDKLSKDDVEDFRDYLLNEKSIADEYPCIFGKMVYPKCIFKERITIEDRGANSVIVILKKFRQFFKWMNDEGITTNDPFKGVVMGVEKYGTPFYITTEERDKIASTPMPTAHLTTQRDIFVFHCLIGCRISDLIKLTLSNITDGVLSYTPRKTQNEGAQALQARIPLHDKAKELLRAYKGKDKQGRLFPFISPQKYNDAIKEIFTIAGITRMVEVRNALSGEIEQRPINEVASSHLARRTFCGNLYFKVQDPNLIGKMSGHTEGSKAFARYRKVEDETLKNVIDLL